MNTPASAIHRVSLALALLLCCQADAAKLEKHEIKVGDLTRHYYAYVPDILKDRDQRSGVLAFHARNMTAQEFHKLLDPDREATDYGFVLVYPVGLNKKWNAGKVSGPKDNNTNDDAYLKVLLDKVVPKHKLNKDMMFAMGFSDGAQMAAKAACTQSNIIRGAAMVSHTMNEWGCNPDHEVSMILIHGLKDPIIPYGGGGPFKFSSHLESVDFFRELNGIKSAARTVKVNDTLKCRQYSNKKRDTAVTGCRLYEDGHQWPGSKGWNVRSYGPVNSTFDSIYFILRRFYKMKGPRKPRDTSKIVSMGRINAGLTQEDLRGITATRKEKIRKSIQTEASRLAEAGAKSKPAPAAASTKPAPAKPAPAKVAARPAPPQIRLAQRSVPLGKGKLSYGILMPPERASRQDLRISLVFSPKDISGAALAGALNAPRYSGLYDNVLVHVPAPDKMDSQVSKAVGQIADSVAAELGLEAPMVFLVGFSDGGAIVQNVYCGNPAGFRAVATIGYTWAQGPCDPQPRLPLLVMHSKQDKRHAYKDVPKGRLTHEKTLEMVQQSYPRNLLKHVTLKKKDHRCSEWHEPNGETALWSCTQDWGGNTIPGAKLAFADKYGKVMSAFDGPGYLYRFMDSFEQMPFSFGLYRHMQPLVFH